MNKVVKIEHVKWKKNWRRIILDSGEFFDADQETVFKADLEEGKELSENEIKEIKDCAEIIRGKEAAYNYLTYSFRTEKEIYQKLLQKGISKKNLESILNDLKRLKLVNDEEAAKFIIEKLKIKGHGRIFISSELRKKGIKQELIAKLLPELYRSDEEIEIAGNIFKKRLKKGEDATDIKVKKRQADYLYRKGFDWEIINKVLHVDS